MTLHASKGLEFKMVFIIGVNQGLIPLAGSSFEQEEEERRLFFVGMTRAKDYLDESTMPGMQFLKAFCELTQVSQIKIDVVISNYFLQRHFKCPKLVSETNKFKIKSESDLKLLLFGIDQRFYTTPDGEEKRIANSITTG